MDRPLPAPRARTPQASFAARVFGYDVFISFALGGPPRGSQGYASDLARRLRERDLTVFFSEDEAPPGSPLSDTLAHALRRSRLLVVIVNRGTLEAPNWVRTEVEAFRTGGGGRPVIPVCLDSSIRDEALSRAVQPWLQHAGHIWLDEDPGSAARGLASDALVTRLLTAPHRVRANARWRAVVAGAVSGLGLLAALAAWQAVVATRERDRVAALRDQALSRQLAAQSAATIVRDPSLALLLAAQARAVARTPAADGALLGALLSLPVSRLAQHDAAFSAMAARPGGGPLILSDARGAVLQAELDRPGMTTLVPPREGINLYGAIDAIAFSPDGRRWAYAGSSREIVVREGDHRDAFPDGDRIGETTVNFVTGLAFSPDGRSLASASTFRALRLRDLDAGTSRLLLRAPVDLAAAAFSPDGRWIAVGGDEGFLRAVPVAPGASAPALASSANGTVVALAFGADGRTLFAASLGGRVQAFDTHDERLLWSQDAPEQGSLERMAVSADGHFIATGHGNGAVLLWSWSREHGAWRWQVLLRHAGRVAGLAFAADGRRLVSVGQDGRLVVTLPVDQGRWQRRAGVAPPAAVATRPADVRGVRSPDGRWVAWEGTAAPAPAPFALNLSGLASTALPRLTLARAADGRVVVDGAELPAERGDAVTAGPVFSADSGQIAVQVDQRLLFWDVPAAAPLDAALALPPDARLGGAAASGRGWTADVPGARDGGFVFDADPAHWSASACALAQRPWTPAQWRRYVGDDRPFEPACGAR